MPLVIAIILAFILVGTLPVWPHSMHWGLYPCSSAGLILACLIIYLVLQRTLSPSNLNHWSSKMNIGKYQWVMIGAVVALIVMLGYGAMTMKDNRTGTERIDDAMKVTPDGADKVEQQLESRTQAQKMGDGIKNFGDKLKDNAQSSNSE